MLNLGRRAIGGLDPAAVWNADRAVAVDRLIRDPRAGPAGLHCQVYQLLDLLRGCAAAEGCEQLLLLASGERAGRERVGRRGAEGAGRSGGGLQSRRGGRLLVGREGQDAGAKQLLLLVGGAEGAGGALLGGALLRGEPHHFRHRVGRHRKA